MQGFKVPRLLSVSVVREGQINSAACAILDQLRQEPAFSRHLPDHSVFCTLSLVSMPDPAVQKLCKENSIELPRIVPAHGVWVGDEAPTFHQLFAHVWNSPKKGKIIVPRPIRD